jgi:mRNA interferase MazF
MVTEECVSRGYIHLVAWNPARGSEIRKTRPCVVVSPDGLNAHLRTFIVAPLTTGGHPNRFRVRSGFDGKEGYVVVGQLRVVAREPLVRRLGRLSKTTLNALLAVLQALLAL